MRLSATFSQSLLGAILLLGSSLTCASGFFDLVRFDNVSDLNGDRLDFSISPPGGMSGHEVSWPNLCWDVHVIVPRNPQHPSISVADHQAALARLQGAARIQTSLYFGPAGRGLVPTKGNRCELNSKALRLQLDATGKEVIFSFNED